MDDSTLLLLDFGESFYAFVYGTVAGRLTPGFGAAIHGTEGSVLGTKLGEQELRLPEDRQPHVNEEHAALHESHVFEDVMQLVDWVREGKPSIASVEHARHVVDIIESAYHAAETGRTQDLRTSFEPLLLEAL
jgi:predicted dehydrogenase